MEATQHRMRPILLTAAAASLGLMPIAREIFWGPMAYAMMGGIIVGTLLTLLFLPALYVAWFRIKQPDQAPCSKVAELPFVAQFLHGGASIRANTVIELTETPRQQGEEYVGQKLMVQFFPGNVLRSAF